MLSGGIPTTASPPNNNAEAIYGSTPPISSNLSISVVLYSASTSPTAINNSGLTIVCARI
ncbi:hypothetical protein D1872_297530 [compost metagenome]